MRCFNLYLQNPFRLRLRAKFSQWRTGVASTLWYVKCLAIQSRVLRGMSGEPLCEMDMTMENTKSQVRVVLQSGSYTARPLVSVGAMGAAAPTDFKKDWFCTLSLWGKLILCSWFTYKSPFYLHFLGALQKICTHGSEIPTISVEFFLIKYCKVFF